MSHGGCGFLQRCGGDQNPGLFGSIDSHPPKTAAGGAAIFVAVQAWAVPHVLKSVRHSNCTMTGIGGSG
jgi:hypothetical protein